MFTLKGMKYCADIESMPKPQPFLSKSKYLEGSKCSKLLWYEFNRKEVFPAVDAGTQAIFDQGHVVGELAQKLYPDGIKLERERMPEKMHAKSMEALKARRPLFEAGMIYGRTYALPDILVPAGKDAWDIIEVKSSTAVDETHLMDAAFQKYVYEGAGLKIRRCYLMHIDNNYVRKGEIEPEKLFKKEDITRKIAPYSKGLKGLIDKMLEIISGKEPKAKIGPNCSSPYPCPLEELCWGFLPEGDIFQLRGKKEKLYDLLDEGILKIADIPPDERWSEKQLMQINSHKTGKVHVDTEGIKEFLDALKYPLYLLDFETIAPAIPAYDLSHPYEWIPFQFSLHIVQKEHAKPVHYGYLAPGDIDPRPEVLKRLKDLLGSSGTVLAYNMTFEINCLKKAVEAYPEYKGWFGKVEKRFTDLLTPFRSLKYYNPKQEGSASIKYVLPALTGSGYEGMEIADGGTASREYSRVTFGDNIDPKDRRRVRDALEKYCAQDTQAMIDVMEGLREAGRVGK